MDMNQHSKRIHPMVAIAAATVTLFSLLGIAAITGILPSSRGSVAEVQAIPNSQSEAMAPVQDKAQPQKQVVHTNKTVVANNTSTQPVATSAPAAKAEPKNSAVGIGVGAVVGGALGSQIGSGDGKTLATILGAVGGGYVGNEIAKKNQN